MELSLAHFPALLPIHSLLAHTCMHMHTSTHMHTYTHKHVHTQLYTYTYLSAHTCTYIHPGLAGQFQSRSSTRHQDKCTGSTSPPSPPTRHQLPHFLICLSGTQGWALCSTQHPGPPNNPAPRVPLTTQNSPLLPWLDQPMCPESSRSVWDPALLLESAGRFMWG